MSQVSPELAKTTPELIDCGGLVYNVNPIRGQDIQIILTPAQIGNRRDRLMAIITDSEKRGIDLDYPEQTLDCLGSRRWSSRVRTILELFGHSTVVVTGAGLVSLSDNRLLVAAGLITACSGLLGISETLVSSGKRDDLINKIKKLYSEKIRRGVSDYL